MNRYLYKQNTSTVTFNSIVAKNISSTMRYSQKELVGLNNGLMISTETQVNTSICCVQISLQQLIINLYFSFHTSKKLYKKILFGLKYSTGQMQEIKCKYLFILLYIFNLKSGFGYNLTELTLKKNYKILCPNEKDFVFK